MKKNRPGVTLHVLCYAADIAKLERIIFRETSTLGIRRWAASRHVMQRSAISVQTLWGESQGKLATLGEGRVKVSPEYDSCREISDANDIPLQDVYTAALDAYRAEDASSND